MRGDSGTSRTVTPAPSSPARPPRRCHASDDEPDGPNRRATSAANGTCGDVRLSVSGPRHLAGHRKDCTVDSITCPLEWGQRLGDVELRRLSGRCPVARSPSRTRCSVSSHHVHVSRRRRPSTRRPDRARRRPTELFGIRKSRRASGRSSPRTAGRSRAWRARHREGRCGHFGEGLEIGQLAIRPPGPCREQIRRLLLRIFGH